MRVALLMPLLFFVLQAEASQVPASVAPLVTSRLTQRHKCHRFTGNSVQPGGYVSRNLHFCDQERWYQRGTSVLDRIS